MCCLLGTFCVFIGLGYFRTDSPLTMVEHAHRETFPRISLFENQLLPFVALFADGTEPVPAERFEQYFSLVVSKQVWTREATAVGAEVKEQFSLSERFYETAPCKLVPETVRSELFHQEEHVDRLKHFAGVCVRGDPELFVQGQAADQQMHSVALKLKPCALGAACRPARELTRLRVLVANAHSAVDLSDLDHPVELASNVNDLLAVHPGLLQLKVARVQLNEVLDFRGIFPLWRPLLNFSVLGEHHSGSLGWRDASQLQCLPQQLEDDHACQPLLEYSYQSSSNFDQFKRRYKSLPEAAGEVGGVKSALFFLFCLLYSRYSSRVQQEHIRQQVYGSALQPEPQTQRCLKCRLLGCLKKRSAGADGSSAATAPSPGTAALENICHNMQVTTVVRELDRLRIFMALLLKPELRKRIDQLASSLLKLADCECRLSRSLEIPPPGEDRLTNMMHRVQLETCLTGSQGEMAPTAATLHGELDRFVGCAVAELDETVQKALRNRPPSLESLLLGPEPTKGASQPAIPLPGDPSIAAAGSQKDLPGKPKRPRLVNRSSIIAANPSASQKTPRAKQASPQTFNKT